MPTSNQSTAPKSLNEFQKNYSTYLRSPATETCPEGIPERRSQVYEELVFNNTYGFIDKCFPVAKSLFTDQQWLALIRSFFKNWACHTPYFSKIPFEFVQFINNDPTFNENEFPLGLPEWLGSLLHYEWIELDVELSNHTVESKTIEDELNITLETTVKANPTLMNLQYDWPVHKISLGNVPNNPVLTHLLVYRDPRHCVQFMEINALTSALIQIINTEPCTVEQALKQLMEVVPNISKEQAYPFGQTLIANLLTNSILCTMD
jgi:hypothetical protein